MSERRYPIAIVFTAVALLALLNLPGGTSRQVRVTLRETLAPLQLTLTGLSGRLGEAWNTVRGIGDFHSQQRRLEEEVARLSGQVNALQACGRDNIALREQLGFLQRATTRLIPAEIIGRDASGWWQTVRLWCGRGDGLRPGLAVVTPDGLAGRTMEISTGTCEVLLISDATCRVSARLGQTGAFGVVSGRGVRADGQVRLLMEFVDRNARVNRGDTVYTSGLGGVFPPDLLIGRVESVDRDPTGLYQRAEIQPAADLARLRYVFVLTGEPAPAAIPDGEVLP